MRPLTMVMLVLPLAGCGAQEVDLDEPDFTRFALRVGPWNQGPERSVSVELEWRDEGCYELVTEVRATLDDWVLENTYRGGTNSKAGSCNDFASFSKGDLTLPEREKSELRIADESLTLSMNFTNLMTSRTAAFRDPESGHVHLDQRVVLDWQPVTDRPGKLYAFFEDEATRSEMFTADPSTITLDDSGFSFTVPTVTRKPNSYDPLDPGSMVTGVLVVGGELAPRIDGCDGGPCTAVFDAQVRLPLTLTNAP